MTGIMKIFIANPPWVVNGRKGVRAGSRWPHLKIPEEGNYLPFPFFLAYTAALLRRAGWEVVLCDAIADDLGVEEFFHLLQASGLDVLLLETSTPSLPYDLDLISQIRTFFNGDLVLAGPDGTIYQRQFLERHPHIDVILVGEYEYTFLEFVRAKSRAGSLKEVPGLIYRDTRDRVVTNPRRPLIANLDDLPWPERESLPMLKYEDRPGGIPAPSVQILASRGCPFRCGFCLWPQLMYDGTSYRARDVARVVDEMENLVRQGFKSVYFDDDTFNIGRQRMLAFAAELKNRRLQVPFAIMARADAMDEDVLRELRHAGLWAVKYGVESGVQELVDNIHKDLDLEKLARMVKYTRDLGIFTHLSFTFGLPGETKETIKRTIDFAQELNPDSVQFSITTPFPGTAYYHDLKKKNFLISRNLADFDGNFTSPIRTNALAPEDLVRARQTAYDTWHRHRAAALVRENLDLVGILTGQWAFKGPFHAQIDLTEACNNNCLACWCNSPLLGEFARKSQATLPYGLVAQLVEDLADLGTYEIYLSGGGEPFMHPQIMEIIELIKKRNMVCHLNTNFTLVTRERARRLIDAGVDTIIASLWAATPETYVRTHPNKDARTFHNILETLDYLLKVKKNKPYVKLYNVIFSHNFHEFDEMVQLALDLNTDLAEFTVVDIIPGKTESLLLTEAMQKDILCRIAYLKENVPYEYEWQEGNYIFHWAQNRRLKLFKFEHFIRRLLNDDCLSGDYDRDFIQRLPCYIGWIFTRILSNGDVNACLKAHKIPVGNVHRQSFREIWNGTKQRQFRQKALSRAKDDPLFALIGNDPVAKIGCFKGCDDIVRNVIWHHKIESLTPEQRRLLEAAGHEGHLAPC
jgi:anaerobic magnesium-protoporphyrin IX monomethyl ester cyclase